MPPRPGWFFLDNIFGGRKGKIVEFASKSRSDERK
jgi:hypothetical protein